MIKSVRVRWVEHVMPIEEMRNMYRILVGKPVGKRSLGRTRHKWEGNIKRDLKETELEGVDCIHLAQDMGLL
jgi:hypothetical protein